MIPALTGAQGRGRGRPRTPARPCRRLSRTSLAGGYVTLTSFGAQPAIDRFAQSMGSSTISPIVTTISRALAAALDHARHASRSTSSSSPSPTRRSPFPKLLMERQDRGSFTTSSASLAAGRRLPTCSRIKTIDQLRASHAAAQHRVKVLFVLWASPTRASRPAMPPFQAESIGPRAKRRTPSSSSFFQFPRAARLPEATLRDKVGQLLVDHWLDARPEVGPLPHLHDQPGSGTAPAGVGDQHEHAHHGHDHDRIRYCRRLDTDPSAEGSPR